MADTIRRVSYYYTAISDKPGEGARLLETLRSAGVNLLAFHAFPSARKAQVDFVPSDAALFTAAAKGAKIKLSKPKTAFLIDGDDRVGALAGILARLGAAKINVTAAGGGCSRRGGDGAPLWGKPGAANKTAAAPRGGELARASATQRGASALARSANVSSLAASAASSSKSVANVSSRLTDFAARLTSTGARSMPRARPCSHVPSRSPSQPTKVSRSCRTTSRTVRRPTRASRSWNLGPMSGMSASANWSMKSASAPGATTCTPSAALPGRGLARPAASFATNFDVPPPIDRESDVSAITASRIRRAVAARGSPPYSRSVPERSR